MSNRITTYNELAYYTSINFNAIDGLLYRSGNSQTFLRADIALFIVTLFMLDLT
jgi:hypothetical protein